MGQRADSKEFNAEMLSIIMASDDEDHTAYSTAVLLVNGQELHIPIVVQTDIHRDYATKVGDEATVQFKFPLGDFVHHVWPYSEKVKMSLTSITLGMKSTVEYKVIFQQVDKEIKAGTYSSQTQEELNKHEFTTVNVQLLNSKVEQFKRANNIWNIYKKVPVVVAMEASMFQAIGAFSFFGFGSGLEMTMPHNWQFYKELLIPTDILAVDVPTYLQTKYGYYSGHIANYIQMNNSGSSTLYIFPPYMDTGFEEFDLYITNPATLAGVKGTYAMDGNKLKIISTLTSKQGTIEKPGDKGLLGFFSGIRSTNCGSAMHKDIKITPKKAIVSGYANADSQNVRQYNNGEGEKTLDAGETCNIYPALSKMAKENGVVVQMTWQFSNARLLSPGMMANIILDTGKQGIKRLRGTLLGVHIATDNNKQVEMSYLNIFVSKDSNNFSFLAMFF